MIFFCRAVLSRSPSLASKTHLKKGGLYILLYDIVVVVVVPLSTTWQPRFPLFSHRDFHWPSADVCPSSQWEGVDECQQVKRRGWESSVCERVKAKKHKRFKNSYEAALNGETKKQAEKFQGHLGKYMQLRAKAGKRLFVVSPSLSWHLGGNFSFSSLSVSSFSFLFASARKWQSFFGAKSC